MARAPDEEEKCNGKNEKITGWLKKFSSSASPQKWGN